ncbi:MAG TPA: isochorismatase family protein [Xanthobacteraceae bacterium]|nr:isochorismatase family protein [Xanthobacteraceae bacterium]
MAAIWDKFLTEQDRAVLAGSGFGRTMGFGARPALLVIDVSYAFCGDVREPILDSVKKWRTSCGEAAWDALPVLEKLIAAARAKGLPVIYTTGYPPALRRPDNWGTGLWKRNVTLGHQAAPPSNHDGNEIMPQIAPQPQDIVLYKNLPSAFQGTYLQSHLVELGCDSLIVTGTTTSGCVRATVLDAFHQSYRSCVVADGCFDRFEMSHAVTLFDINAKYGDVLDSGTVLDHVATLPDGLFKLPAGRAPT